jgi:hypothetical protein
MEEIREHPSPVAITRSDQEKSLGRKYKLLNLIKMSFIVFSIIFLITLVVPYYSYSDPYNNPPGLGLLLYGGIEGYGFVIISIFLTFSNKIKYSITLCFIGIGLIALNIWLISPIPMISAGSVSIQIGFYLVPLSMIGFLITNILQFKLITIENDLKAQKYREYLSLTESNLENKTNLLEMIKSEKKLDLDEAQNIIGIPKAKVKATIYDLVGEGKLEGSFKENIFMIISNIDDFVRMLDQSFKEWEETTRKKAGKS